METKNNDLRDENKIESEQELISPVSQMRPDDSHESINTSPSSQEVRAAVEGLNPDENSMNSRG